jgi:NAD+ kinase
MKLAVIYNSGKAEASALFRELEAVMKQRGIEYSVDGIEEDTDYIISIGGDGTVLRAARLAFGHDIPVAGMNVGKLGFLGPPAPAPGELLDRLESGKCAFRKRMLLKGIAAGEEFTALNDMVIKNGNTARVIELELYFDGRKIYHLRGDGLIVSTATGSTAYSLAAGGPLMMPGLEALLVTPLNPHSIHSRSLVLVPSEIKIVPVPAGAEVIFTADGQSSVELKGSEEVLISPLPSAVSFVCDDKDFFEKLNEKFGWR